jgi:hypothetical protein
VGGKPVYRFKNDYFVHNWKLTGFVESGRWGFSEVVCRRCEEVRMVYGFDPNRPGLKFGCWRIAFRDRWRRGDLAFVDGSDRLDYFWERVNADEAITRNAGGGVYRVRIADLRRYQ